MYIYIPSSLLYLYLTIFGSIPEFVCERFAIRTLCFQPQSATCSWRIFCRRNSDESRLLRYIILLFNIPCVSTHPNFVGIAIATANRSSQRAA
jgi:hypothetical protein